MGRLALFVRLAACNLSCAWCDTPYSWDWKRYDPAKEIRQMSVQDVTDALLALDRKTRRPLVVITGGEPMIQGPRALPRLVEHLSFMGFDMEIETNGTLPPLENNFASYIISPKLASNGADPEYKRIDIKTLWDYRSKTVAYWKFVVTKASDLAEVWKLVDKLKLPSERVWLMPCSTEDGVEDVALKTFVADSAIEYGYNYSDRLQVHLWRRARKH